MARIETSAEELINNIVSGSQITENEPINKESKDLKGSNAKKQSRTKKKVSKEAQKKKGRPSTIEDGHIISINLPHETWKKLMLHVAELKINGDTSASISGICRECVEKYIARKIKD